MSRTRLAIAPWEGYEGDAIFDASSPLNRDDCCSFYRVLRSRLEELGGWCHTIDVCRDNGLEPDVVLFLDMPAEPVVPLLAGWPRPPAAWVELRESDVILPRNWDLALHEQFEKLLTWDDRIVDGERYLKSNFTNRLRAPAPLDLEAAERNLATLIAGDKSADHPLELYSERRRAIRWFEQHHPEHFALYGQGWSGREFPSYRGTVDRKLDVLGRYWFTICFENARGIPGYITEKIFDCFLARTVPVYLGPDNVCDHIPADAFVDMRRFSGFDELYEHLVAMEPEEYAAHLESARRFLASGAARQFSDEGCADVVVSALLKS